MHPAILIHWDTVITSLLIAALTAAISGMASRLGKYTKTSEEWRQDLTGKVDTLMGATQTTMRATLIHNAEKYFERGWITPEERASWCDMHDKYSSLGANGLIETYRHKIDQLHDKTI